MIIKENIQVIYENWSLDQQIEFLQKCYLKLMEVTFNGSDDATTYLLMEDESKEVNNTIYLSGEKLKDYSRTYLERYASKEEKEQHKAYCDYLEICYAIVIATKGDRKAREKLIQEKGLTCNLQRLKNDAYKFCYLIKGIDNETAKKIFSFKKPHRYDKTLEQLIELDDEEKIIEVIGKLVKKEKSTINLLEQSIHTFIKFNKADLSVQEKEELSNQLSSKLKIYQTYNDMLNQAHKKAKKEEFEQEKMRKEKNLLPRARQMIEDFNNITASIRDYCQLNNIPLDTFKQSLSLLCKYDPESYNDYLVALEEKEATNFNNNKSIVEQLLVYLKNGVIQENGTKRPFDLLDYYFMTTSTLEALSHCIEYKDSTLSENDYHIVRKFLSENKGLELLDVNQIMNTTLEVNAKRDENDIPIAGSGRIITNIEKEGVIEFLENNNIPLTVKVYNLALNRYIAFSEEITDKNVKPKQMLKSSNPNNKN